MERRVYSAKMRRLAAQAYKRHPMQLCLWVLEQIALRAVALSPLYIALRLGYSMTAALILCLALYLLMIYPLRFRAALTLTRMVRLTDASRLRPASYPARVGAGALRLLLGGGQPCRGLLFILPAAFLAVSLINLLAFSTENLTLLSFVTGLPWLEPGLLFGWLGLLLGAVIDTLLRQMKGAAHA